MEYKKIVQRCLDIGEALIGWGAEIWRVEDGLERICDSYGFPRCDVWALATMMQMTVETPDGEILTRTREVRAAETDYDKLTYLNDLCRYICQFTPEADEIARRFEKIKNRKTLPEWKLDLTVMLSAVSFTVFFGGNVRDVGATAAASLMMWTIGKAMRKWERNMFVYNAILSFLAELLILLIECLVPGIQRDPVTIGIVMLLISGLRITNGIRDLLHKDTFTGILNIMTSVIGAAGIACGTALAMVLFADLQEPMIGVHANLAVRILSSTIGCAGFAVIFGLRGRPLLTSGIGALLNYVVYLAAIAAGMNDFGATMLSAVFVSGYAFLFARVHKAPATIFLTLCVFPMIPGAKLYYTMYGIISRNAALVAQQSQAMLAICVAIVVGFMIGDIIQNYLNIFFSWWKESEYRQL